MLGFSLLTAIGASLCCITPVLALFAGVTGLASTLSWLEPMRPVFLGVTIVALAFAWFYKLKPKKKIECVCETTIQKKNEPTKFNIFKSTRLLGFISIVILTIMAFLYYSGNFYGNQNQRISVIQNSNSKTVEYKIKGMTCVSCEQLLDNQVRKLPGVISTQASYKGHKAIVVFDQAQIGEVEIEQAIQDLGYQVTDVKQLK